MKLYGISGLGADSRVYDNLKLNHKIEVIHWDEKFHNKTLSEYAKILCSQIDSKKPFGIIGVSFGGILALEIGQILKPKIIVQISSMTSNSQINLIPRVINKLGVLKLLPSKLFKPPHIIAKYLFGAENFKMLFEILDQTDLDFAKWATINLLSWKGTKVNCKLIRIHGTKDKLIRMSNLDSIIKIKGGEHFMIVDRANEISEILNKKL